MQIGGIRLRAGMLALGVREARNWLRVKLRGEEPDRKRAALAWVRANAPAGDPAAVLAALDDFGRRRRFLMNVGDQKGPMLRAMARALPPGAQVLELGAFVGYSAVLIASNLPEGARLVSLELDPGSVEIARAMVEHAGLAARVEFHCGDSAALIPTLEGPFALVFIDHWKDVYLRDLRAIEQHGLLRAGSVVVADNVGPMFDAHEYLDYVRGCGHYETRYEKSTVEYSSIEDGVEISVYRPRG